MDINQYNSKIEAISHWKGEIYRIMEFQLNSKNNETLLDAIEFRKGNLNDNDCNISSGYLSLGIFKGYGEEFRTACICICLEAEYKRQVNNEIRNCSSYEGDEPIFNEKELSDHRNKDLIDYRIFKHREPASNIFKFGDIWGYFDRRIPAQFYEWIDNCFADKPCRIRVEPYEIFSKKPEQMLIECMVIPPQFRWWDRLDIYTGNTTGSEYILLGDDIKNNRNDYYDYHFLNIRRLEVSETRKEPNYISMMIEEIEEHTNMLNPNEKYLIGRMIHLDSNATIGTCFKDATLNHIDLAYNLYINQDADNRLNGHLCYGKTQNATFRTHILRIENIPFKSLFKIAYSFLKSKTLTSEWLSNEFTE